MTTASSADHPTRRDFLFVATGAVAAVGAAAAVWPLVAQMNPDAATIAAGAPIEVDLTPIAEGQDIKVFWRGKPIYISHRTKKQIEEAQKVPLSSLPDPQPDSARVKAGHDQWLVVIGICTHLGCIPIAHEGNYDGFFCPCHGSRVRHLGPHPLGTGAHQPAGAALHVRFRYQNPDRLRPGRPSGTLIRRVVLLPQDRINERTIRFPADQSRLEVDRTAPPDHGPRPFLVRGLSDAA